MKNKNIIGDILGGVVSAFVALPLTLACGLLIFKGINGFEHLGINAAIFSAIIGSLISGLIGIHPLQISGPRVVTTLILSDLIYVVFNQLDKSLTFIDLSSIFIVLMIVTVGLSGIFQLIFAYFKVGRLIKFLPHPVVIGVSTTIGLIIVVKQIPSLFNNHQDEFFEILFSNPLKLFEDFSDTFFLLSTVFLILLILFSKDLLSKKFNSKIFNLFPLIAPLLGIVLFLIFPMDSKEYYLNEVNISFVDYKNIFNSLNSILPIIQINISHIIITAFSIALMGTLNSLVSISILETKIPSKIKDTSVELRGQGIGNIIVGFFAGLPSSGSEARGLSNFAVGGRTILSIFVHTITLILIVFIFNKYLVFIPVVVLSAILIHTGLLMVKPTMDLILHGMRVCLHRPLNEINSCIKDTLYTLFIIFIMLITNYFKDVSTAVLSGFALASLIFIVEMMKNTDFKIISASFHRSRKVRTEEEKDFLDTNGKKIKIIELEGAIFFGTADSLRVMIDKLDSEVQWVILDFRKVTEADITGAEIIKICINENKNINFVLSYIIEGDDTYQALCSAGVINDDTSKTIQWFYNTDYALEYVEDKFLKANNISPISNEKLPLEKLSILHDLDKNELETLSKELIEKTYKKDEHIFNANFNANELYFLTKGTVSIKTKEKEIAYENGDCLHKNEITLFSSRRITFSPGVVFGEMAFFQKQAHEVDAVANEEVCVFILTRNNFEKLILENPILAQKLTLSFCKHLSSRLKDVTNEIHFLEKWD
ncbi:MAG: SulP family inorganic anion transporter [Arcobacter sp.]|uniref:SulP family inorganic anion transporter n=1 Tax=Arcobacter sp. TaxID=1872629 RepID=UPI0025834408|nr:SulP family inorganic anion transporter [Arcobacter sp.]MDD3008785.1 SulP family inorganic anion transporter [Arcobacter sp.]